MRQSKAVARTSAIPSTDGLSVGRPRCRRQLIVQAALESVVSNIDGLMVK
jgi:hypothetical protein